MKDLLKVSNEKYIEMNQTDSTWKFFLLFKCMCIGVTLFYLSRYSIKLKSVSLPLKAPFVNPNDVTVWIVWLDFQTKYPNFIKTWSSEN